MKKLIIAVIAAVFALALCACAGNSSSNSTSADPNAGVYKCTQVEYLGVTVDPAEVFSDGESSLEIKDGNKASMTFNGESQSVDCEISGKNITFSTAGQEVGKGTIENGKIVIDLLDMGMKITFVK